jgi:hypothetical protein
MLSFCMTCRCTGKGTFLASSWLSSCVHKQYLVEVTDGMNGADASCVYCATHPNPNPCSAPCSVLAVDPELLPFKAVGRVLVQEGGSKWCPNSLLLVIMSEGIRTDTTALVQCTLQPCTNNSFCLKVTGPGSAQYIMSMLCRWRNSVVTQCHRS